MNKPRSESLIKRWLIVLFGVTFISLLIFLLIYRLDNWPSVWWDEGWTLDAARNWIEDGHLGHYLDGQPIPPHIPVRFPVVVPVAISMKIFGVGTWQGRLPDVISTILSLGLVFYLSTKMFNRRTSVATFFLILLLSVYLFHPFVLGRQVMAEMPMMLYLLGGYTMLWLALTHSRGWVVGAAILFGIAIHAKLQVPPFWLVSITLAIIMSVIQRQRRSTLTLVYVAVGSIVIAALVLLVQNMLMPGSFDDPVLINILFNSVVFVLVKSVRIQVLFQVLLFGAPLMLSYIWAGWHILRIIGVTRNPATAQISTDEANRLIIQIALWGLGASWFVWYTLMSIHTIRYMFPPFFIGCVFVATFLGDLTSGFNFRVFVRRISRLFLHREFRLVNFQTFIMLIALSINLSAVVKSTQIGLTIPSYDPVLASTYLRENIPIGAKVESFESELFFLAPDLKYHFPSDLVSMQAQRKTSIDPQFPIDYNPMEANPDYLVVGPMGHLWPIYEEVIAKGLFKLDADIGGYQIYHNQANSSIK